MRKYLWIAVAGLLVAGCESVQAQLSADTVCPRPQAGSTVEEPADLRSRNGVLEATLTARDVAEAGGAVRYCYIDAAGRESPTLRVNPGDLVVLHLKNSLTDVGGGSAAMPAHSHRPMNPEQATTPAPAE